MSPIAIAFLVAISASQVFSAEYSNNEIMDILISVNRTVNELYDKMITQKDRDIALAENHMDDTYKQLRSKRDTSGDGSEAVDKIQDAFNNFKDGLSSFMKNITSSDIYKQAQKFGEDLQSKGKELGAKIEETIKNARKDSNESS